jgi:hypothetical protein
MSMNIRLDEDQGELDRTRVALTPPDIHVKPTIEDVLERIAVSLESIGELAAEAVYGRNQDIRVERAREIAEQISVIHTASDGSWIHGSQENLELAAELIEALLSQDEIQRVEDATQRR